MGSAEIWHERPAELERARAEQPVIFPGAHGGLFGLFTPPAPTAPPADCCVVFFTRPRSHRNRMWVEAARRIAAAGFAALRFDYHGLGDSEGELAIQNPDQPFQADALAVLRGLREQFGQQRFVLVGSCFDARTALSAFAQEGAAVAGLVFIAAPTMSIADLEQVALGGAATARELPLHPLFVEHFAHFVASGARGLFLYGAEDAEYETFRVAEQRLIAPLSPEVRKRFDIVVWPGAVHGFLEVARQREGLALVLRWIEERMRTTPAETAWTST